MIDYVRGLLSEVLHVTHLQSLKPSKAPLCNAKHVTAAPLRAAICQSWSTCVQDSIDSVDF